MPLQETEADQSGSWSELLSPMYAPALALVCLAVWLHAGDSLIVTTMTPSMVAELGGENLLAWLFLLYILASVVVGGASALLTMTFGLRLPMALAALMFGLGCLISALAGNMPVVLMGRVLQGMGGGILVSIASIAVREIFPSHLFPKAMAAISTLWGSSAFLGPLLGGLFVEYANWRWGFAAFAAQAFALALFIWFQKNHITPQENAKAPRLPWMGLALLTGAVLAVAYAGVEVSLARSTFFIALGALGLAVFLRHDARAGTERMLPKSPFNIKTSTGSALLMVLCLCAATGTNNVFGTILLTRLHGLPAIAAGYVLAAGAVGWSLAAFSMNGARESADAKLIGIGTTIVVSGLVGFALIFASGPVWAIAALCFAVGWGFGMCWGFIVRRSTNLADPKEAQRVTAAITTVQRIGYALGAAYIGIVGNALNFENTRDPQQLGHLASWLFVSCLPIALYGLFAMLRFISIERD
ncbi:MAG: MFS transporter [Pseudomonadota bacterium]